MKAITIWQPWASLAACGAKPHETRSRATNYRGPIAIHAAKKPIVADLFGNDEYGWSYEEWLDVHELLGIRSVLDLPYGEIVATAELVECWRVVRHEPTAIILKQSNGIGEDKIPIDAPYLKFGDYRIGRYIWALADVEKMLKPIPAKGKQGLWNWEA